VRDWQNITFRGQAIGFSQAKCAELLSDRTFRNLLDFVLIQCSQREAALVSVEADSAGN
jgi:superfamily I DNA and RNA helicase